MSPLDFPFGRGDGEDGPVGLLWAWAGGKWHRLIAWAWVSPSSPRGFSYTTVIGYAALKSEGKFCTGSAQAMPQASSRWASYNDSG